MEAREMVEVVVEADRIISIKLVSTDRRSGSFVRYPDAGLVCMVLHKHTVASAFLYLVAQISLTELPEYGNLFEHIQPSAG